MQNIIALIWDFDKTLINGYMQDPIFNDYNVDPTEFWHEVNSLPKKYKDEQNVRVNPDTIYLNQFIHYAQNGKFKGLCNDKLKLMERNKISTRVYLRYSSILNRCSIMMQYQRNTISKLNIT